MPGHLDLTICFCHANNRCAATGALTREATSTEAGLLCMSTPSSPRYATGVLGRLFVVRWRVFRLVDLADVRAQIAKVRRIGGRKLVYLSLIPASPRTFSQREEQALAGFLRDLLVHDCESIHHVIEGEGFVSSARRSIVTNMAISTSTPGAFQTYGTLEEAVAVLARTVRRSEDGLMTAMRERSLTFPAD